MLTPSPGRVRVVLIGAWVIFLLAYVSMAFLSFAHAAEPPKTYTLTLTLEEVTAIWEGVQELPFKTASPLLAKIQEQVNKQDNPSPVPKQDQAPRRSE